MRLSYFFLTLYLIFSSLGLIFIKLGSSGFNLSFANGMINFAANPKMIIGAFFYLTSFLLFLFVVPRFNLSFLYPFSAGILFLVITLFGLLFLGEKISAIQLAGSILILIGIILINNGR